TDRQSGRDWSQCRSGGRTGLCGEAGVMQHVWGLRWGLKNIDGALRDEPDVEYHAKGELAVTYQAIGESQLRDATVPCWSDPSLDDCEADGENDPVTEPTLSPSFLPK